MAWGRQWRGNDADDCTAIIVNNHVAPDQWRDKPDFLSDKLLGRLNALLNTSLLVLNELSTSQKKMKIVIIAQRISNA